MNESPDDRTQGEQFGDGRDEVPSLRIGRFRLYEPATTITDVLLAALAMAIGLMVAGTAVIWAIKPLDQPQGFLRWFVALPPEQRLLVFRILALAGALGTVGVAAALGAWIHGTGPNLSQARLQRLWTAIGIAMTTAATLLLAVAASISLALNFTTLRLPGVGVFALVAALTWLGLGVALRHGEGFLWGQLCLGVAALAVAMMAGLRVASIPGRSQWEAGFAQAWWIGCVIYAVATVLHRLKIGLHRHFDHNALYHVLQMAAIIALGYVAAGSELGILSQYLVDLIE